MSKSLVACKISIALLFPRYAPAISSCSCRFFALFVATLSRTRADQNGAANEPLAFKAIKAAVTKATEISNRKHEATDCFSISFEADDSGADRDVQSFRMIAEDILGASFTHLWIAAETKDVGLWI